MDKRFFLALVLTGVVLIVPSFFMKPPAPPAVPPASTAEVPTVVPTPGTTASTSTSTKAAPNAAPVAGPSVKTPVVAPVRIDTINLRDTESTIRLLSVGAAPIAVGVPAHKSFGPTTGEVAIEDEGRPLLSFQVVTGNDTLHLDRATYRASGDPATGTVTFNSADPGVAASIEYRKTNTPYLTHVRVAVPGASGKAFLLLNLAEGFTSQEADTVDDIRHLSYAAKPIANGAKGIAFSSLDPGERSLVSGPLSWAVAKSKYFLVGVLSPSDSTPLAELQAVGGTRLSKLPTRAHGTVVTPLVDGRAEFDLYAGPQEWERMRALGRDFETANPYGGFMQGLVQPFATIVMRIMLWMKKTVRLDYGWVLVIFGLAIRIVLWPLNQSAMRTSIKLQRVQPELMAAQERYKNDRTKQQQEILRIYQEHGMSPFSALSGCLPAIIPMPVFFALFFVFQNTIEFRGVPFLWLGDISLKDPLYILPIVTGASMFVLSWIGMRNMPKNPQATMMLYLMPGMFTVFLLSTASGLSIYYLVQQIAAIPQQWMIANERRKAQPVKA
jgi:YidC/Oxa1 family membrane protein insertase